MGDVAIDVLDVGFREALREGGREGGGREGGVNAWVMEGGKEEHT
jgi:hypothetical protein